MNRKNLALLVLFGSDVLGRWRKRKSSTSKCASKA